MNAMEEAREMQRMDSAFDAAALVHEAARLKMSALGNSWTPLQTEKGELGVVCEA